MNEPPFVMDYVAVLLTIPVLPAPGAYAGDVIAHYAATHCRTAALAGGA